MGTNIYGILHLCVYPLNDPQKAHIWYSAQTQVSSGPKRLMRFKWIIQGKILLLMFAARPESINVMIWIMLPDISQHTRTRREEKCEKNEAEIHQVCGAWFQKI